MQPRMLGLAGGPRRHGNSERLLEAALEGGLEAGAATELVRCGDLDLEGCRECGGCDQTGVCVVADQMQPLYEKLLAVDHLIFATPVFFLGVPSQGKRVIDRCQALWNRQHVLNVRPDRPGRRGLLIATAGAGTDRVFGGVRDSVRAFFAEIGVQYWYELTYGPLERPGDILGIEGALESAKRAGVAIVKGDRR